MCKKLEFANEYKLHMFTQDNLNEFGLKWVASERSHEDIRIDNIAFDCNKRQLVLIEYKNEPDPNVICQAKKYYDLVKENPKRFNFRLNSKEKFDFDKDEDIRVIIIGPEEYFNEGQINNECDFEVWGVSFYEDGRVIYKDMKTKEVVGEFSVDEKEIAYLTSKSLTEEEVILENDELKKILGLYCSFKDKVSSYEDVALRFLTDGVSFRVNNQIACIAYFNKNSIKLHYNAVDDLVCPINETNNCEICPKNRTNKERDCPEDKTNSDLGCLRNIKCKDYVGNYEFILKSEDNVDFAFEFFKQVYNEKTEE